MKHWNDLDPLEQGEYNKGRIGHNMSWRCYWKWLNRDTGEIEIYSEYLGWDRSTTYYSELSNVFDWK